jgi:hypothetical protein
MATPANPLGMRPQYGQRPQAAMAPPTMGQRRAPMAPPQWPGAANPAANPATAQGQVGAVSTVNPPAGATPPVTGTPAGFIPGPFAIPASAVAQNNANAGVAAPAAAPAVASAGMTAPAGQRPGMPPQNMMNRPQGLTPQQQSMVSQAQQRAQQGGGPNLYNGVPGGGRPQYSGAGAPAAARYSSSAPQRPSQPPSQPQSEQGGVQQPFRGAPNWRNRQPPPAGGGQ